MSPRHRILLVYPPKENIISTNIPEIVQEGMGSFPPLGLMYLASAIEKFTEWEVEILDTQAAGTSYALLEKQIASRKADVVGIQVYTFSLIDAYETARIVRKVLPDARIVMGGPHVNIYPAETMESGLADYVCLGEGEYSLSELLGRIATDKSAEGIKGIWRRESGRTVEGPHPEVINDLDALPFPSRKLVPADRYKTLLSRGRFTTLMSSRGCPYRCIYCDRPQMGKKFRPRSAVNIADEIETCLRDFGIRTFFFYDDTFNIDRVRVMAFCRELKSRSLGVKWDIRARIDRMDEEMLDALADAGCERIHYGIESGSQDILDNMRKDIKLDEAKRIVHSTKKAGIETLCYFMLGNPGEKEEHIKRTVDFACSLDADYAHIAVTIPFPGTPLYALGLERKIFKDDYWREFAQNPSKDFVPRVWEENFSREELIARMNASYRRFYFRPQYMFKTLFKTKSPSELIQKITGGIGLLFKNK